MAHPREMLSGTCENLLFSPRGGIEGVLMSVQGRKLQISMTQETGAAMAQKTAPGKRLRVLATADHSPKTADAAHPVYQFDALADASGQPLDWPGETDGSTTIKGVVERIHYARHGQPNGVVLATGEFIHLRPHGSEALTLAVGSKVTASGEMKMTILGTRMLEARHANGYDIE